MIASQLELPAGIYSRRKSIVGIGMPEAVKREFGWSGLDATFFWRSEASHGFPLPINALCGRLVRHAFPPNRHLQASGSTFVKSYCEQGRHRIRGFVFTKCRRDAEEACFGFDRTQSGPFSSRFDFQARCSSPTSRLSHPSKPAGGITSPKLSSRKRWKRGGDVSLFRRRGSSTPKINCAPPSSFVRERLFEAIRNAKHFFLTNALPP